MRQTPGSIAFCKSIARRRFRERLTARTDSTVSE